MIEAKNMRLAALGLVLLGFAGAHAQPVNPQSEASPRIVTIKLDGMVDDGMNILVSRAVREAVNAEAIVFIVDTPGGRVDSAITISDQILKAPCKTVAYIDGMGAISAGALISYACDEIVMAPATNMGAAQVVTIGMEGTEPLGEKETSFVRAKFAALAELKGRDPDIAMAMVDKDIELRAYQRPDGTLDVRSSFLPTPTVMELAEKVANDPEDLVRKVVETITGEKLPIPKPAAPADSDAVETVDSPVPATAPVDDTGVVIKPAGKLLTLTPKEAQKYGVIKNIAEDMDQLKWQLGYTNHAVVELKPTWSEDLYRWLISPQITMLLLVIGIGGLYLEIKTPGFGLPGIVGIAALAIFFGSRSVVGLSDWLDIALVIIGISLIAIEVFLIPGFGFIGVLGIIAVICGVILSFTFSDFSIPQYSWEWDRLEDAGFVLSMTTLAVAVFVIATWKLLPKTPLYSRLVLQNQQLAVEGYSSQAQDADSALGQQGVATSMLRPAGRGRFGNKTLQVVSLAEYIEEGTPIVIVQVEGNRFVVDRVKKPA